MEHSSRIDDVAVPEDRFRGIANETLIIWGMEDKVIDYTDKYGERLEAALPNAKLQRIADCGHIPQEEKPAETDKLLKNFL
jgi:pimeloyl-ACP methyl ester carboxylesterase